MIPSSELELKASPGSWNNGLLLCARAVISSCELELSSPEPGAVILTARADPSHEPGALVPYHKPRFHIALVTGRLMVKQSGGCKTF